jgi:DNA-binding MarR family transcriptional regulator
MARSPDRTSTSSTRSERSAAPEPTPDVVDLAARLRLSATRLARQLRQEAGTGLTPSQLSVLASLDRRGALTLGELAECERVAPPSITKVVAKLEEAELIRREPDANDRRVVHVRLTAKGGRLLTSSRQRKNAWLAARLAELPAAERARVADALDVLEHLASGDPTGGDR